MVANRRLEGTCAGSVSDKLLTEKLLQALEALLPPKKTDIEPRPAIVDEADYEESDVVEVRARSVPAGSDFFDHGMAQFGEGGDDDWEDEDEEYDEDGGGEPECRAQ